MVVRFTFAKYSLVKSIKIAEGAINYKVPDFKIMAMYKNDGNGDTEIDIMPESGYAINEIKSYCTLDNINKDTKAKLFTNEEGNHVISGLSKSSKCYLYFDKKEEKINGSEELIANITVNDGTPDFSKVATTDEGVYKAKDESGEYSYYFRGAVTNNYVKFANKYWRIIRINGDGSIRLIYDGTSAHANGTSTSDSIAVANVKWSHKDAYWNTSSDNAYVNNNAYVGFKYTVNQVHGLGTKSNALTQLETWYTNNLSSYASNIDTNAGFCGDRAPYICSTYECNNITSGGGTGTTITYYGTNIRLRANKAPVLTCVNTSDLYTINSSNKGNKILTYSIGLISADEVAMAGGLWGTSNQSYYLYNGQFYWTLSPQSFGASGARIFTVYANGTINDQNVPSNMGLRPVINLRSDTQFTFEGTGEKGTMTNPYIVS